MWRHNWIEEIEDMENPGGIQPWSQAGSTMTSYDIGRPYTGIGLSEEGEPFVVYADGISRAHVNPKLAEKAAEKGGRLIATLGGWQSERSLLNKG